MLEEFDWKTLLLGKEEWSFLIETILRTVVMFTIILLGLRLLGKRGIKQLSVFELGVIIGLGSAAGDPMFYKDVGLLAGIIVFIIVIILYRLITFLVNNNHKFERFVEGEPVRILNEGRFIMSNFKKEPIARDEFFAQLRLNSISHLGQVEQAIMETNGEVSIFYYPDKDVRYGLPILPSLFEKKLTEIPLEAYYACTSCGKVEKHSPAPEYSCDVCHNVEWVKAINNKRIH